jgi:hypothetical protein
MGPELLRVKDLARRANKYSEADYREAMKVLKRVYARKEHGIIMTRGAAGKELVPSSSRPKSVQPETAGDASDASPSPHDEIGTLIGGEQNELLQKMLLSARRVSPSGEYDVLDSETIDIRRVELPINSRYRLTVYSDASFAVGELKQSVSGYVVYLNGIPILWGSLKQTIVVDSSCSAEFVAASIACKQLLHAENMISFFGFSCPKPYCFYTDSKACLHIATNAMRLGNVRHLLIRYHLVRCCVSLGDVEMFFCVTEEMVADLFTKLVVAAQDTRLTFRFYSLILDKHHLVDSNDFKRLA